MVLLHYPDPFLREKANIDVTSGEDISEQIEQMSELMKRFQGIGLASTQVGQKNRVFIVNLHSSEGEADTVFINPHIIQSSVLEIVMQEGCLSIPNVYADVTRPEWILIQATDERGNTFQLRADGLLARVILHEYDHLQGKLFIDYLSEKNRKKILDDYFRQQNP